jgi:hypothetical protein
MQYKQTPEKRTEILRDYFLNDFPRCFPDLEPILDADGKVLCIPSYALMFDLIRNAEFLRKDIINEILLGLYENGLLVKKPEVIERIVEVERKPTAEEIAKAKKDKFEREAAHGFHQEARNQRTELDRDDQYKKPPMTEGQKQAQNAKAERENQIIADVQSRINSYTGATHSKTYSARDALKQTFVDAMNKGLSAEQVQKAVEAKLDSFAGNNSVR